MLRYREPAPLTLDGWEQYSLPLGNGHFGVNVFGGIAEEWLQLTDKAFFTDDVRVEEHLWNRRSLTNFADVRLQFTHPGEVTDYERSLDLHSAIARVDYEAGGVRFQREMFASHPGRIFALRLSASLPRSISFTASAVTPFLDEFRSGETRVQDGRLVFGGESTTYGLLYEGQLALKVSGGIVRTTGDRIEVEAAALRARRAQPRRDSPQSINSH